MTMYLQRMSDNRVETMTGSWSEDHQRYEIEHPIGTVTFREDDSINLGDDIWVVLHPYAMINGRREMVSAGRIPEWVSAQYMIELKGIQLGD